VGKTLPAITATTWVVNIAYAAMAATIDHELIHPAVGSFLRTALVVVSIACIIKSFGMDYRIGYRQGRADQMGEQD